MAERLFGERPKVSEMCVLEKALATGVWRGFLHAAGARRVSEKRWVCFRILLVDDPGRRSLRLALPWAAIGRPFGAAELPESAGGGVTEVSSFSKPELRF